MKQFIKRFIKAWKQAAVPETGPDSYEVFDSVVAVAPPPDPPIPAEPAARDLAARKYFLSAEFEQAARKALYQAIVMKGDDHAKVIVPDFSPDRQDLSTLWKVVDGLKADFPVQHVYINAFREIIFDSRSWSQRQSKPFGGIGGIML